MMNLPRCLVLLSVAVISAAACDDPEITPSGNLARPSALSYVAHDEKRGDLLIADAEAQGVRVLQLLDDPLQGGSTLKTERQSFVRAPTVAFPLLIPAARHPTHVVSASNVAFALSTVDSAIHVIDVQASEFGASAVSGSVDTYKALARLELNDPAFGDAFPVALRTNDDREVFVLFDRPQTKDSLLGALKLNNSSGAWSIESVVTATLSVSSPRDFIVRNEPDAVAVVSSAASSSVAVVGLTDSDTFDLPRYINVGGPSNRLVDAEESGVVVFRLDRPALVLLEVENGALQRSGRRLDNDEGVQSPYTPRQESDAALLDGDLYGRIDLPSPAVAGAFGRLENLRPGFSGVTISSEMIAACAVEKVEGNVCSYLSENGQELTGRCGYDGDELACLFTGHVPNVIRESDRNSDGLAAVVYVVLVDGRDAFLAGSPLRLVRSSESFVERIEALRNDTLEIDECEQVQAPSSCEDRQTALVCSAAAELSASPAEGCAAVVAQASSCTSRVLSREFESAASFKVEYRGNLFSTNKFSLSASQTSTTQARLDINRSENFSSSFYQVRAGDRVDIQLGQLESELEPCADLSGTALDTALSDVGSRVFSASYLMSDDATINVQLEDTNDLLAKLLACGAVFKGHMLEFYPADEVMVLAEFSDSTSEISGKIHDRAPVQTSSGADFVEFDSVLRLTVRSTEKFSIDSSCERRDTKATCASDSECAEGLCTQSLAQNRAGQACLGTCEAAPVTSRRVCNGYRFEVYPSVMNSNPVTSCPATTQGILIAAPEDTTFVAARKSWFTSVPGSRALRETILTSDNFLTCAIYR